MTDSVTGSICTGSVVIGGRERVQHSRLLSVLGLLCFGQDVGLFLVSSRGCWFRGLFYLWLSVSRSFGWIRSCVYVEDYLGCCVVGCALESYYVLVFTFTVCTALLDCEVGVVVERHSLE